MALGDVLRGLGSVLNPMVAQDLGREDLQRNQLQQQAMLMGAQQKFSSEENTRKIAAQYQLHQADLKQRAADKLEQIKAAALEGRITREQAAAEVERVKKETQERDFAFRREMAQFMAANRQQPQPQLVTNEQGVFQVDRSGNAVPVTVGGQPLPGKPVAPEKALPVSAAKGLLENQQNLRRAEQALELLAGNDLGNMKGDTAATGWKGFVPDAILQRADPQGIDARAAIGDLGSLVIHDRSGAAVTAAEFPRLRPFIPQVTDDPETAKKKLARFVQVYKEVVNDSRDFYKESGYKVPESKIPTAGVGVPKVGDIVDGYRFKGGDPADKNNWVQQ